jgi:uncharacterized protein (TIGR00369 family)
MDMLNFPEFTPNKDTSHCFGCGTENAIGLKLKFTWDEKSHTASADFTPDERLQGWSGFVHGGISACVMDEAMGWVGMFAGANNVTARLQVRYRKMIAIGHTYKVSCTIIKQTNRLIETRAAITDNEGTVLTEATSTQYILGSQFSLGTDKGSTLKDEK